jgi:hypothetical protein
MPRFPGFRLENPVEVKKSAMILRMLIYAKAL